MATIPDLRKQITILENKLVDCEEECREKKNAIKQQAFIIYELTNQVIALEKSNKEMFKILNTKPLGQRVKEFFKGAVYGG